MDVGQYSCVKLVTQSVHLALPVSCISNEIAGVTEVLESWKRQYVPQLQGVVVAYSAVSILPQSGFLSVGRPCLHVDVRATFELFCPRKGDILCGRINRISREHVGCLAQGIINATIHLTQDTVTDFSRFLYLDKEILFQITDFDFQRKIIRVHGRITEECVKLMEELFPEDSTAPSTSTSTKCLIKPAMTPVTSDDEIPSHQPVKKENNFVIPTINNDEALMHDLLQIFKKEQDTEAEMSSPEKAHKNKNSKSSKKRKRDVSFSEATTSGEKDTVTKSPKKRRKGKSSLEAMNSEVKYEITKSPKKRKKGKNSLEAMNSDVKYEITKSPKKHKRERSSIESLEAITSEEKIITKTSPKKRKREESLSETPEAMTSKEKPKKKKRRKKVESPSKKANTLDGVVETKFSLTNSEDILQMIKSEGSSPEKSKKGKNKKEGTSNKDGEKRRKKMKRKEKGEADGEKKSKSKDKKKLEKKKGKHVASGNVFNKDKKKSKKDKSAKKGKKSKKDKSKSNSKKNKLKSENTDSAPTQNASDVNLLAENCQ